MVKHLEQAWWDQWRKEFLPSLITRAKTLTKEANLEAGDFVIVMDENTVRFDWPFGVITTIYPGPDDLVRVAEVKVGHNRTLTRPIWKLVKLPKDGDFTTGENVGNQ